MLQRTRPVASRLLTVCSIQSSSRVSAVQIRRNSTTPNQPSVKGSNQTAASAHEVTQRAESPQEQRKGLIRDDLAQDQMPKHSLDYNAVVDYRTSQFTPIPLRVVDGSEPGDTVPAAVVSGAPVDLQARTVRIFKPAKPATQSGTWHGMAWLMDWDPLPKGHRWENPLMGWQSTGDFMQGERIGFKSKEDAIRFAEKQGYEYFVQEPNARKFVVKAYANNFTHVPGKLKIVRTK